MAGPWYVNPAAGGSATGLSWTNAFLTNAAAAAAAGAGETVYFASTGDQVGGAGSNIAMNWSPTGNSLPVLFFCAVTTAPVPGPSDLATTGVMESTTSGQLSTQGNLYMYGMTLRAGSSTSGPDMSLGNTFNNTQKFESCHIEMAGTGNGYLKICTGEEGMVEFRNVTMKMASTGKKIYAPSRLWWISGGADAASSVPSILFEDVLAEAYFEDLDLSVWTGITFVNDNKRPCSLTLVRCKMPSSYTLLAAQTKCPGMVVVDMISCSSAASPWISSRATGGGLQTTDTGLYLSGGSHYDTTSYSWKLATTAVPTWYFPFLCMPIGKWNPTTGSNVTITLQGIYNGAAIPNNDDYWYDVSIFGSASSTLGTLVTTTKANGLATGTALTASTATWTGPPARANTTVYAVNDQITVASNLGRIFFCTTGGTSAGSEPGGYATAIDGGSVTDNGAVFRAGWRFQIPTTFSAPQPQLKGDMSVIVKAAKVSTNVWFDVKAVLT